MRYRQYFGFKKEPFSTELKTSDLMKLANTTAASERINYGLDSRGVVLLTGDVGSGKSTALRWSCAQFQKSEVLVVPIVAQSGSLMELLRAIALGLGISPNGSSKTLKTAEIKGTISELYQTKRQKVLVAIDECHLLRSDVYAELHTLTQFEYDSKNMLTLVLCGQESALEKLRYRNAGPIASRVIAKGHLSPLTHQELSDYLAHHLKVAGKRDRLFDEGVTRAIYQGSGGIPRKSNSLAKGALIAACDSNSPEVTVEHVRMAASELL